MELDLRKVNRSGEELVRDEDFEGEDFTNEDFEDEDLVEELSVEKDSEEEDLVDELSVDEDPEDVDFAVEIAEETAEETSEEPAVEEHSSVNPREWRLRLRKRLRKRQRHLAVLLVLGLLMLAGIGLAYKASVREGWHDSPAGRYYLRSDGRAVGQRIIDGVLYLFDSDGYLIEGPAEMNGRVYYSTPNGIFKGVTQINGEDYCFCETDGVLKTNKS